MSSAAIILLALASKELCKREINLTSGGQFTLGYSGYGEAYCTVSGLLDPILFILVATLLVAVLFQLLGGRGKGEAHSTHSVEGYDRTK